MKYLSVIALALIFLSCENKQQKEKIEFINENVSFAEAQTTLMLEVTGEPTGKGYPRTMRDDGQLSTAVMRDWTTGFFPGSLWYLYELTGKEEWRAAAQKWTETLEPLKTFTGNHDLGFMMYCSYGNAERLSPKPGYNDILIESSKSLSTRYREDLEVIKSWDFKRAWSETVEWSYPVIIDNMMNLEMLFYATKVSGDSTFYNLEIGRASCRERV